MSYVAHRVERVFEAGADHDCCERRNPSAILRLGPSRLAFPRCRPDISFNVPTISQHLSERALNSGTTTCRAHTRFGEATFTERCGEPRRHCATTD